MLKDSVPILMWLVLFQTHNIYIYIYTYICFVFVFDNTLVCKVYRMKFVTSSESLK